MQSSPTCKIARGLDYYTGTVFETELAGFESLGSICSGGRYDSLASDGKVTFPGVGISLGVSRLLVPLLATGRLAASRSVPTCVLVAVSDESERAASERVADALRARGISTEVAPSAAKFGKQIRHADRRGIPYVWFPRATESGHSVKDIRSGDQVDGRPAAPGTRRRAICARPSPWSRRRRRHRSNSQRPRHPAPEESPQ